MHILSFFLFDLHHYFTQFFFYTQVFSVTKRIFIYFFWVLVLWEFFVIIWALLQFVLAQLVFDAILVMWEFFFVLIRVLLNVGFNPSWLIGTLWFIFVKFSHNFSCHTKKTFLTSSLVFTKNVQFINFLTIFFVAISYFWKELNVSPANSRLTIIPSRKSSQSFQPKAELKAFPFIAVMHSSNVVLLSLSLDEQRG